MSTIRFTARSWLHLPLVFATALVACSGSSSGLGNQTSAGEGGVDASAESGGGSDAGLDSTGGPDTGGGPADATTEVSVDGASSSADSGAGTGAEAGPDAGTEPSYLRNDAIAGFAFTADFGSPYDSILGAPLNTTQSAIAPGAQQVAGPSLDQANERFQLVATSADVYNTLDISASLSASAGLASVNTKTSFAKSVQIDTTALTVLVDETQIGTQFKIVNPTLTAQAAALTPEQFYTLYGDRYAAEIVTGAEMFCVVSIETYSQQDKTNLTMSLGFSYGSTSASASFASSVTKTVGSRQVDVNCQYLGYMPNTLVTDLPTLETAVSAFEQGTVGTSLGTVDTKSLYLLYTSYYGIPGYPGVPAGTDAKVAQQAQVASDYLLYSSLVTNDFADYYGDTNYSSLPFFTDLKAYSSQLSQYMTAVNGNSQNPGMPVPTPAADALISNWVSTPAAASAPNATPSFQSYVLGNGIVPKRISDYGIPLRYAYPDAAGNGTLGGTTFTPALSVPFAAGLGSTAPVTYELYLTNKAAPGAASPIYWLEYQWDTGTYYFPNATTNGGPQPDASLIKSAIVGAPLEGNLGVEYVVVNKANGMVLTDMGGSNGMAATHLIPGNGAQLWGFYVDNGAGNCSTFVAQASGSPGVGCSVAGNGNYPSGSCGSGIYATSYQAIQSAKPYSGYWNVSADTEGSPITANGPGGCAHCNQSCGSIVCADTSQGGGPSPWDTFFLESFNSGTTWGIYDYPGSVSGTPVSWMVTDPNNTPLTPTLLPPPPPNYDDAGVVVSFQESVEVWGGNTGQANQLWVFIPSSNVDKNP
jgi:hypothetical protein